MWPFFMALAVISVPGPTCLPWATRHCEMRWKPQEQAPAPPIYENISEDEGEDEYLSILQAVGPDTCAGSISVLEQTVIKLTETVHALQRQVAMLQGRRPYRTRCL